MWQQLKETALVGTDKKPLDTSALPEAIQKQLQELPSQNESSQFLQASAMATYYLEAGKLPATFKGTLDDALVEETGTVAPVLLLDGLKAIEDAEHALRSYLLDQWLDALIAKEWVVSSDHILRLINLSESLAVRTRRKVAQILGARGQWILSFKKDHGFQVDDKSNTWEEGTTEQRKTLLEQLLITDQQKAIELLQSTWTSEPITSKRAFISLLTPYASEQMMDFVQELYANEFAYKPKEKKTEKECRKLLVATLLRIQSSELFQNTARQLASYFESQKRSGLLSFGSRTVFQLPSEVDEFWNPDYQLETFGLDQQYDIAMFANDQEYWLAEFLELIPLSWWASHFSKGLQDMITYFIESFQSKIAGKMVSVYVSHLIANVMSNHDQEAAEVLIQKVDRDQSLMLAPYLSMTSYEDFLIRNKLTADYPFLENSPEGEWSLNFCKESIAQAYHFTEQQNYYPLSYMGKAMAKSATVEAEGILERYHQKAKDLGYFKSWEKHYYAPIKASIHIKKLINSFK